MLMVELHGSLSRPFRPGPMKLTRRQQHIERRNDIKGKQGSDPKPGCDDQPDVEAAHGTGPTG